MKQFTDPSPESTSTNIDSVSREGALSSAFSQDDSALRFLQFIKKRGWLVLVLGALGLGAGIVANMVLPRLYTAKTNIEVEEDKSEQFRLEPTAGMSVGGVDAAKLDTEIEILRSRTLALEVIRALHLETNPNFAKLPGGRPWDLSRPGVRGALAGTFLKNLTIARLGHTNIIQIYVTSSRPELASLIANTLIDSYIEHTFRDNYTSTAKISGWLDSQLGGLKDNLQKSQSKMLDFQRDLGVFGLDQTQSITISNLEELNKQVADAQVDRLVKEARYRTIVGSPSAVVDAFAGVDPGLQATKLTLTQLRTEYISLIQTYGPAYPRVKELRAQMDQLQSGLKEAEDAQISRAQKELEAAQTNEKMLRGTLDAQEQDAYNHGAKAIQYELARREYESNRLLYDGLQQRLQEAGIMAGLHSSAVHVVDDADTPVAPSQPRVNFNIGVGLGLGLVLGLALAFIQEALDTNLKTMTQIEQGLQLPLVAAIPSVSSADLQPSGFKDHAMSRGASSWSRVAEALRGMRTSILLSSPGSPPKVIMLTSSRPAEGKTSVACLTAITFALNGSRTLLIDADLRRPSVHIRFKLGKQTGLSTLLSGKLSFREAVLEWPELPHLHILPSGPVPPLPSELLGSKQLENLLTELRAEYDFIVIDTPPVLTVTDASILGRLTDATVLILRYGQVQRQVALRCIDLLERSGAKLLGIVVNAVNFESPEYAEYYGRKYYEYYGERNPE